MFPGSLFLTPSQDSRCEDDEEEILYPAGTYRLTPAMVVKSIELGPRSLVWSILRHSGPRLT